MTDERKEDLLFNQQYDLPEDRDGFVDEATGIVTEKKDIKPFDVIKAVASQLGQEINDPKESCKYCYGRGYTARDCATKQPIPCQCIYPKKDIGEQENDKNMASKFGNLSRKKARKLKRIMKNDNKRLKRREKNKEK